MADSTIAATEGSGILLDSESLTVGSNTVKRQRVQVYGAAATDFVGLPAHDEADTGSPLKIGGKANQSVPTAVSDADRVNAWFDREGAAHTVSRQEPARVWVAGAGRLSISRGGGSYASVGSPGTSVVAAAASTYTYVVGLMVSSVSAVGTLISFSDGSGGTALFQWYVPVQYQAMTLPPVPGQVLFRTSANTALFYNQTGAAANAQVWIWYFQSTVAF